MAWGNGLEVQKEMSIIFLDPGHGGKWRGECAQGLKESRQNLCISNKVARILEEQGQTVHCSHRGDSRLPPESRVAVVKRLEPTLLVIIHHSRRNIPHFACVSGMVGAGEKSKLLAKHMTDRLSAAGLKVRGLPCFKERSGDVLGVQEKGRRAGIVVEFPLCIRCVNCRDQYAEAVALGIIDYIDKSSY